MTKAHPDLQHLIRSAIASIQSADARRAASFSEQIYLREPQRRGEGRSRIDIPNLLASSNSHIDLFWSVLIEYSRVELRPRIEALYASFLLYHKRGHLSDRLMMHHAVLALVYGVVFVPTPEPEMLSDHQIATLYAPNAEKLTIPAWAVDKHTARGCSIATGGISFFVQEGLLEKRPSTTVKNIFFEEANRIYLQEEERFGSKKATCAAIRERLRYGNACITTKPSAAEPIAD